MATIQISQLTTGTVNGQIEFPATNPLDTSSAPTGTTYKYIMSDIQNYILSSQGLTTYAACVAGTTANLTATYANGASGVGATLTNSSTQAVFSVDGVTPALNSRILVKNQSSNVQNGIYTLTNVGSGSTNWVLTRATDFDQSAEIIQYGVVLITQGTVNAGKLEQVTSASSPTIGTDPITFAQYTTSGSVNEGIANQTTYYASAGNVLSGVGPGSAGQLYQSNGSGSAPAFTTATYPSTNTLAGAFLRGDGTNYAQSAWTVPAAIAAGDMLYGSSTNNVSALATVVRASLSTNSTGVPTWLALTNGQIVIGSTAGSPAAATLTAGTNVTITNASNSITIDAAGTGGGLQWNTVAGTTQAAAVNNGYVIGNAAQTTVTLPGTAAVGSVIAVAGQGAGGFILAANTGQTIKMAASTTSSAGSLTSAEQYDAIQVVCVVANLVWVVQSAITTGFTIA